MQNKLFDSEARVMEIIWGKSPISAKDISLIVADTIGWNKNTTYTVIKKLEAKVYSVLQSLHPVFAALSGLIFLKEHLTCLQWLAVLFIVTASAGAALSSDKR